jgi:hypothetical protein
MRDEILSLLGKEPFVPFRIVTTSGREYEVSNPSLVAMGQSLMHVFFPKSDRYSTLRLTEIVSTEVGEADQRRRKRA